MGNANRTLDPNRLLNDRSAVSGGIRLFPAGVSVFGNLRAGFATGARCPGAAINPQAAELYVATTGYWHNSEEMTITRISNQRFSPSSYSAVTLAG